jgi:FdhD protein
VTEGAAEQRVRRLAPDGHSEARRTLPIEAAIAVEFNGIGYAVMMATPTELEEFVTGFALSERIVLSADEIGEIAAHQTEKGWRVQVQIAPERVAAMIERVRVRVSESSCGLCGLENLEQVARPLPPVTAVLEVADAALFAALGHLRRYQPLNALTGGVHAAAFCDVRGNVRLVREDVGRHNALDKLIGALARARISPTTGFFLLSSRCSFELVEKTVLAGCPLLVTISTATTLAATRAAAAGLRLVVLARPDAMLEVLA